MMTGPVPAAVVPAAVALAGRIGLASAVRAMVEQLATSTAGDDVLAEASRLVDRAVTLLAGDTHEEGHARIADGLLTGLGPHGELGPFTSALHVFAPPVAVDAIPDGDGQAVTGVVTYGDAYEGAPGCVQGGFIVATFDEILGLAQAGSARMTARIEISYRSPALLNRELCYTARLGRLDGRKAFVEGTLHDGDRLCAEAQGLFIAPRPPGLIDQPEGPS